MKIALYQEFGEGCHRLTHSLLPDDKGWELADVAHVGTATELLTAESVEIIQSSDVVIASPLSPLPDAVHDPSGRVRLIQLLSAGYDKVDLERCRAVGQLVATNGGANAVAVAEHTIMFILAALRRLPVLDQDTRAGRWTAAKTVSWEPHELEGRTVGLVGMGRIGREVARRLRPFDVRLQYYDVVRAPSNVTRSLRVRYVSWNRLLQTSDIISLHVPLIDATRGLIGFAEFEQMKPGAMLINTARGGLIDEAALIAALRSGQLGSAGLDAFDVEPVPAGHPLAGFEQVVLTPHLAGPTFESWPKRVRFAYENIARLERGERPDSIVPELAGASLRTTP